MFICVPILYMESYEFILISLIPIQHHRIHFFFFLSVFVMPFFGGEKQGYLYVLLFIYVISLTVCTQFQLLRTNPLLLLKTAYSPSWALRPHANFPTFLRTHFSPAYALTSGGELPLS